MPDLSTSEPTEAPSITLPSFTPTAPPPTTEPPTTAPLTTQPPTTAPTAPTEDLSELIGSLYTRGQLYDLENKLHGYGPGTAPFGVRPSTPVSLTNQFSKYDTWFIGPDDNRVYLTFNCGYESYTTDENGNKVPITGIILDVLKEKNAKAVFFLAKHYCEANADLVWRMINEGHIVANHGAYHKCMPKQSIDGMVKDIMLLHDYVEEHFGYTMKYYRPPSGEYSTRVFAVAQSLGYTTLQFSFSYRDYLENSPPSNEKALSEMQARLHPGAIYQLHTVTPANARVLGEFIDFLRAEGYETALFT